MTNKPDASFYRELENMPDDQTTIALKITRRQKNGMGWTARFRAENFENLGELIKSAYESLTDHPLFEIKRS